MSMAIDDKFDALKRAYPKTQSYLPNALAELALRFCVSRRYFRSWKVRLAHSSTPSNRWSIRHADASRPGPLAKILTADIRASFRSLH
jgi:hypothetical protein